MATSELDVVTGASGYTGKYIARRLLGMGRSVRTLTGHPQRPNPFGLQVEVAPYNFDQPDELVRSLQGAHTLYNTYWVRFPRGQVTFERAVANTLTLLRAAEAAGVRRIVHVSITSASEDSALPYFKGKGVLEQAIVRSKLSYAILRPTVIFGLEGILINNIAWLLRRCPVFAIPGSGQYLVQPVCVEDVAELAVDAAQRDEHLALDAVGPETYTYEELVRLIARKVRSRARMVYLSPEVVLGLSRLIGFAVNDVVLTRDEVEGLMANLLVSQGPPTGKTRLSDWLDQHADRIGRGYASELGRHYR
ncbi:MAG: NAD(P)H-binding protein [Chloroflexi bacterium]|nr:NAD(P)H-binding protein [Chloroflexota bacterium]